MMTTRFRPGPARAGLACVLGALAALCGLSSPALAQDDRVVLEARGEWEGSDAAARGRAIDRAFAAAVERGLRGIVGERDLAAEPRRARQGRDPPRAPVRRRPTAW